MNPLNGNTPVSKTCLQWGVVFLPLCFTLLFTPSLFSQAETGRITGTVTDVTGAVLPGVEITLVAVETNRRFAFVTDDRGHYSSGPLRVGQYRVEAQLIGFKRVVREAISLQVQETAVVDLRLQIGEISEEVTVTAAQGLIDTAEASQGQVIEARRVQDLPLNGRDYVQLALLSEGALEPPGQGRTAVGANDGTSSRAGGFSAGGQQTISNNYLIDGFDNNNNDASTDTNQGEVVKPSVDAIREFKLQTNAYSAQFGRAAGGVLNLTLKSGSNSFHGTAYEFHRNDGLDARNFFDRTDQPVPPFKRNNYGLTIGGPGVKDKVFFFFSWEGRRRRESRTVNNTIPTLKMRRGDFSELRVPIFDPLTFDPATRTRQPFQGNIIPENRIDPVARQLIQLFPPPQNTQLSRNFLFNPPSSENLNRVNTREDFVLSENDQVFWVFNYQKVTIPPSTNLPPPAFGGDSRINNWKNYQTGVSWSRTFSPAVVTTTKLGWNFSETLLDFPEEARALGNLSKQIGLNIPENNLPVQFPNFSLSGFTSLGAGNFIPFFSNGQTRQLKNDTSWTRGNHTLQFGIDLHRIQTNTVNARREGGAFAFNGRFTNNPRTATGGNAVADFLLGSVDNSQFSRRTRLDGRAWLWAGYLQDDWKVSPAFTLNLGVRYEYLRPFEDLRDRLANVDIDTDPRNATLVLAMHTPEQRATTSSDTNNWGPRIGLAYQLIPEKLVVRAGYGIFFALSRFSPFGDSDSILVNPPFVVEVSTSSDGITPASRLRDGIPKDIVRLENARGGVSLGSLERDPATGYSQHWNLNLQYQLGRHWMFQAGYFATKGTKLNQKIDANYVETLGPGRVNERRRFKRLTVPPIDGTGSAVVLSPLGAMQRTQYTGNSIFHSLQMKVERRFFQGFTLLGSWIYSRSIGDTIGDNPAGQAPGSGFQNPANLRAERSLFDIHLKHRFVLSGIWEFPFGRGRRFGSNLHPVLNVFFGGWNATGILTLTAGRPFTVTVSGNPANSGQPNRPNLVGDPEAVPGGKNVDEFFNTAAFKRNAPFTFGNLGRNSLLGPDYENLDFSLMKQTTVFSVSDQPFDLQFRWEFFNIFNHTNFGFPGSVLGTGTFGQLTNASPGRKMQVGLKLIF